MGDRSNRGPPALFIDARQAAFSEDDSEVCYRWELPAADLPVRGVRASGTSCAAGYRAAGGFGCSACQDRQRSTD
jgi:hypothetical protein